MDLLFIWQVLVLSAPLIIGLGLIALQIIFWIWKIKKNGYAETPTDRSKNKLLFFGYGLQIISLTCCVTIPYNFVFTLGAGMSGDLGAPFTELLIIGLFLSPIFTFIAGLTGLIVVWAWKKKVAKQD
jgi:hypothetical protein